MLWVHIEKQIIEEQQQRRQQRKSWKKGNYDNKYMASQHVNEFCALSFLSLDFFEKKEILQIQILIRLKNIQRGETSSEHDDLEIIWN